MSRVAAIVATRNRRDVLLRTLGRLTSLRGSPRVLVVDNASRDGTAAAVAACFPQVEVLPLPANAGAAARNLAVARVPEPYVAFSDDDSWWEEGALERAARVMDAHPGLGLAAARVLVGPGCRLDPTCAAMAASPLPGDASLPGPPVLGFLACGVVLRRDAFLEAGGFHPRFGVGGEEELLAIDLARRGWGLAYVPDLVAHHHPPPSGRRRDRVRRQARNAIWCVWLRRGLGTAVARTLRCAAGCGSPVDGAASLAQALAGLGWVARQRRRVPAELEARLALLERG